MRLHLRTPARLPLAAVAALALTAGCASGSHQQNHPGAATSTGPPNHGSASEHHQLRQVPQEQDPQVRLKVAKDAESGWNLHLITKRFRFSPKDVNQQVEPHTGHAHLYVDGEKLTRLYGPWYYLPPETVPEGEHTLTVKLNANDHSAWAVNGKPVSDSVQVTSLPA